LNKIETIRNYIFSSKERIILSVILLLLSLCWHYIIWEPYAWKNIEIFSMPPYIRIVLSLMVYSTIWAILVELMFYKWLSIIFHDIFKSHSWYLKAKSIIWSLLVWVMYYYITPFIIDSLNYISTIIYNIFAVTLYISPPIAISWFLIIIYVVYKNKNLNIR
jgi:hypothetical protein